MWPDSTHTVLLAGVNKFAVVVIDKERATKQEPLGLEHKIDGFGVVAAQLKFRGKECWTGSLTGARGLSEVCFF